MSRPLLVVDGDSLAHRAFHALPKSIKGPNGGPGNMLVGFANMLMSVWEAEEPRTVFVGFDSIGDPTYRHELLPGYQGGRDFPPELTDAARPPARVGRGVRLSLGQAGGLRGRRLRRGGGAGGGGRRAARSSC